MRLSRQLNALTEILLGNGGVAVIDSEDYELVKDYNWYRRDRRGLSYAYSDTFGKSVAMHRVIFGKPANGHSDHVDHKDGNGLNNSRSNLRLCAPSDNQHNSKIRIDNTSGFKGVCKNDRGTYRAYLFYKGKQIHLGSAKNPAEAARLYDEGAKKYYGEFARLNNAAV